MSDEEEKDTAEDALSPREKALLEQYATNGTAAWRRVTARRIAEHFAGRYAERRDPMQEGAPGTTDDARRDGDAPTDPDPGGPPIDPDG